MAESCKNVKKIHITGKAENSCLVGLLLTSHVGFIGLTKANLKAILLSQNSTTNNSKQNIVYDAVDYNCVP